MSSDPTATFRCADAARSRQDPPLGTTPQVSRWLLIEHPGPWRSDAVAGSELLGSVKAELRVPAPHTRVLLIRRVGRALPRGEHRRHWAVVDTGGQAQWGSWIFGSDLEPAVDLLRDPAPIEGVRAPLYLVCTHGVHDQCCALRGRPVAAALAQAMPEATWECTHLGGDRFAANLLALPDGVVYGNLEAEVVTRVVRGHAHGVLDLARLRGFAGLAPAAQVALGAVHERLGPMPYGSVSVLRTTALAGGRFQVDLRTREHPVVVIIATSHRSRALLTCRAVRETAAVDYGVDSFVVEGSGSGSG